MKNNIKNKINLEDSIYYILYKDPFLKTKGERNIEISNSCINFLKKGGIFYNTVNNSAYYLDKKSYKLYNINSFEFKLYLKNNTGLNSKSKEFKYILSDINDYSFNKGNKVNIHKISFYNKKDNILYLFNNGNKIVKISEKNIELIPNGSEGILFLYDKEIKKWDYKKVIPKKNINIFGEKNSLENTGFFDLLLNSVNLKDDILSIEEQKLIMKSYFFSLFFGEILSNKPILNLIGEKGAGKSFILEIIQILLLSKKSISNIPEKNESLITSLINNKLTFFDNVDSNISNSKIDLLCLAVNGNSIKIRKLYSDGEEIVFDTNTFIAVTSRNPQYNRDDLVDRMITFKINRGNTYGTPSNEIFSNIVKNRSLIMSSIVLELQKMIKLLKNFNNLSLDFRMIEFANFTYNINKEKTSKEEIKKLFEKVSLNQKSFSNQNDDFLDILISIFSKENQKIIDVKKYYFSKDLYEILFYYVKDNPHLNFPFKNAISLGRHISHKLSSYINSEGIEILVNPSKTGNKKSYKIRKINLDNNKDKNE